MTDNERIDHEETWLEKTKELREHVWSDDFDEIAYREKIEELKNTSKT